VAPHPLSLEATSRSLQQRSNFSIEIGHAPPRPLPLFMSLPLISPPRSKTQHHPYQKGCALTTHSKGADSERAVLCGGLQFRSTINVQDYMIVKAMVMSRHAKAV